MRMSTSLFQLSPPQNKLRIQACTYEYKRSSPLKLNIVAFDIDRPEDFAQLGTWALKLSQTGPWHVHLSILDDKQRF